MEEKVKISSVKDLKLDAIIERSKNRTDKLAILCPGYLDSKDYNHLVLLSKDLTENGFTVVRFDPVGTWESEGDISKYTNSNYLENIKSVLEYMLSEHDYKYVLLGGHSRGGMVSILYAARDPRISLVLGIMPSSSLSIVGKEKRKKVREEWQKDGFSTSYRDIPNREERKMFKVPFSHVLDREKYDVNKDIKNVHVPIIFIAGEEDTAVPTEHVQEIFNHANEPKQYLLLKKIGHNYRHNLEEVKKVNQEIIKSLSFPSQ